MSNITEQLRAVTANINDRMAATTQLTMEKMGNRTNTTEPPELKSAHQKLESLRLHLKDIYKRLSKITKLSLVATEEGKLLAESFRQVEEYSDDQVIFPYLRKVAEFQNIMEDLRSGMNQLIISQVCVPLEQFVKSDVRDARYTKKKYDRVRLTYETSMNALKNVSKKQKVNLNKVLEAEERRNETKKQFESTGEETMEVMNLALEKNSFIMLETMGIFIDSYKIYFDHGSEMLKNMQFMVEESRNAINERKKSYEEHSALHQMNSLKRKEKTDRAKLLNAKGKVIFGLSLQDIKERDGLPYPSIVEQMIRTMKRDSLNLEGIFRISPSKTLLDEIKEKIDGGKPIDFANINESHIAPGLLKTYLRDLPEPLLTFDLYEDWTALAHEKLENIVVEKASLLLQKLPDINRKLFVDILSLCHEITKHSDKNLMTAKSLAIVLSPNILYQRSEQLDPNMIVTQMAAANETISMLIEHFSSIITNSPTISSFTRPISHSFSSSQHPIFTQTSVSSSNPSQNLSLSSSGSLKTFHAPPLSSAPTLPLDSLSLSPRTSPMKSDTDTKSIDRGILNVPSIGSLPPPPPPPFPSTWVKKSHNNLGNPNERVGIIRKKNSPTNSSNSSETKNFLSLTSSQSDPQLIHNSNFSQSDPLSNIKKIEKSTLSNSTSLILTESEKETPKKGGWTTAKTTDKDSVTLRKPLTGFRRRPFDILNTPQGFKQRSGTQTMEDPGILSKIRSPSLSDEEYVGSAPTISFMPKDNTNFNLNSDSSSDSSNVSSPNLSPNVSSPSLGQHSTSSFLGQNYASKRSTWKKEDVINFSISSSLPSSSNILEESESEFEELVKDLDDLNFD